MRNYHPFNRRNTNALEFVYSIDAFDQFEDIRTRVDTDKIKEVLGIHLMSIIYIMFPVALLMATSAVIAFCWAVYDGQLDDLETPQNRILVDDHVDNE